MTFIFYYYNKYSRIVIKPLSLALGYTTEIVIGLGNIIYIAASDFTNKYGFENSI
jgi:hypothetical protein